jgi:tetratricopeptide (TPR) repeat protein
MIDTRFAVILFTAQLATGLPSVSVWGDEPKSQPADKSQHFLVTGAEPAEPFVPLRPRTMEDTRKLEAIKHFCAGVGHEHEYRWSDAIEAYRKALEHDPKSVRLYKSIIKVCSVARRPQDAVKYLRKAVDVAPDDYELLGQLGETLEEDDADAALSLYKRAVASSQLPKKHPMAVVLKLKIGLIQERMRNHDEAAEALLDVMEAIDHPEQYGLDALRTPPPFLTNRAQTYEQFGHVFRQAKRYDDALRAFRSAQASAPRRGRFDLNISQVYIDQEKYAPALEHLEKFLEKETPHGSQPYELLAQVMEKLGRSDEVLPRVQTAADKDKFNKGLQYLLGTLYEKAGDIEKAKGIYLTIVKDPPDGRIYKSLAGIYQKEDRLRDLILLLGEALQKQWEGQAAASDTVTEQLKGLSADPETAKRVIEAARQIHAEGPKKLNLGARFLVAQVAQNIKSYDAAAEFLRLCLEERPNLPFLHRTLASVLEMGGKTDDAIASANRAIEIDPQEISGHSTLAWILTHSGQYPKAIEKYEQILKDFGDNAEVVRSTRYMLSNVYVQTGEMEKSEQALEQILKEHPDDTAANNDLGYLWADQGKNLEQAEKMIRKALDRYSAEREPGEPEKNAAYLDSMGWVLYKLGRPDEAAKFLEEAISIQEGAEDGTIVDHLGDVYMRLKQTAKAKELWLKAQKILEAAEGLRREDKRLKEIQQKLKNLDEQKDNPGEIKRERKEP